MTRTLLTAGLTGITLALMAAAAAAKPLPAGLTLKTNAKNELIATRDGMSIPTGLTHVGKLAKVELDDTGTQVVVTAVDCTTPDEPPTESRVPLAKLDAGFENTLGMKAHLAKKYDEAIKHFTLAVHADPATPVYATNLLSAQSMGGKLAEADLALADAAKHNVAWLAWRLAVDSDLAALQGRPAAKLSATRGTARSAMGEGIAYSPLGLVAAPVEVNAYDGIPDGSGTTALAIVDIATSAELLLLPLETTCSVDMDAMMQGNPHPPPVDKACPKREAAAAAKNRKVADAVLAALGFTPLPKGFVSLSADVKSLVAADGRKLAWTESDELTLDGKPVSTGELRVRSVGFAPHAVVLYQKGWKQMGCGDADGPYRFVLTTVPTR